MKLALRWSSNEFVRAYFVQLERLSSFILVKTCPITHISALYQSWLLQYLRGDMKSIYPELALYGDQIECARTDNAFFSMSEVCDGMVSLLTILLTNTCKICYFLALYTPFFIILKIKTFWCHGTYKKNQKKSEWFCYKTIDIIWY